VQLDKVAAKLEKTSDRPDHTYHLRSLATQVNAGNHVGLASEAMRGMLAEESQLEGERLDALCRITLGALT
ncbi:MAG: hypothetical protein WB682_01615, partial [Candidatus Dormiibacterota bacterium]